MLGFSARLEFTKKNSKGSILLHTLERIFLKKLFYRWNIDLSLFSNSNHLITDIVKQNSIRILSYNYNWFPFLRPIYICILLVLSVLLIYFHESNHMCQFGSVTAEVKRHLSHLNQTGRKKEIMFSGWSHGSMILRTSGSLR